MEELVIAFATGLRGVKLDIVNWFAERRERSGFKLTAVSPALAITTLGELPLKAVSIFTSLGLALTVTGCSIHYYDIKTGTEHLWGIGHLKMRAVPQKDDEGPNTNAVMAYVIGNEVLGLQLGVGADFRGLAAGFYSRSRVLIKDEDSSFYLLWPTNVSLAPFGVKSPFTVRIGPHFPTELSK